MSEMEPSEELRRHFHLFWDNFPFPVLLVRRDRTIVDRTKAADGKGPVAGTRCVDQGGADAHKGCLADHALRDQVAKRSVQYIEHMGVVMDSYWIPLSGFPEFYVHFGINITEYAAERFFQKPCRSGTDCDSCAGE